MGCAGGKSCASALAIHAVAPLPLPFAAARESAPAAWRACCRGRRLGDAGGGGRRACGGRDFEPHSSHGPVGPWPASRLGRCDERRRAERALSAEAAAAAGRMGAQFRRGERVGETLPSNVS